MRAAETGMRGIYPLGTWLGVALCQLVRGRDSFVVPGDAPYAQLPIHYMSKLIGSFLGAAASCAGGSGTRVSGPNPPVGSPKFEGRLFMTRGNILVANEMN